VDKEDRKPTLYFYSTRGKPVDLSIKVQDGHRGSTAGPNVPPRKPDERQPNPLPVHLADDGKELWGRDMLYTTEVVAMTPEPRTRVTYELSGVDDADSQVNIRPHPGDDAKAKGDTVEFAPTFMFLRPKEDVEGDQIPEARHDSSSEVKPNPETRTEDGAKVNVNSDSTAQHKNDAEDNTNPEVPSEPKPPPKGPAKNNQNFVTLSLNVLHDLLDKLTDVLNFGRILSIGVPGFIVNFSMLMLFSLFSARMPTPTQWVVERVNESGIRRDTIEFTGTAGSAVPIAQFDSGGGTRTVVPVYYEQNRGVHGLSFIDRSRIEFDAERVASQPYYWLYWFIGSILVGSLISQWGHRELRKREVPHGIWTRMIRLAGSFEPPMLDVVKNTRPWNLKKLRDALRKLEPAVTRDERRACDDLREDLLEPAVSRREERADLQNDLLELAASDKERRAYDNLLVDLELARHGSDEPSWSALHLPLLRQTMIASQNVTYWDHLTKEYWRFAEFAVNCPVAVSLFCVFLGSYFLLLSAMYGGGAWLVGVVLASSGVAVFVAAQLWWNPVVAFASFNNYKIARSGLIAGLSLFPATQPDVKNPMQEVYTDCAEFRKWYCDHYQGSLALHNQGLCDKKPPFACHNPTPLPEGDGTSIPKEPTKTPRGTQPSEEADSHRGK